MNQGGGVGGKEEGLKSSGRNCFDKTCGCFIRGEKIFKECLERAFFTSPAGRYLERLNGILMLGSAVTYIALSTWNSQEGIYESDLFDVFDKVVCSLFFFIWMLKCYVAQNKKQYLKKGQTIGEVIVTVPILFFGQPDLFSNIYIFIIISRYVRIILGANILTANEKLSGNEVTSQLYKMMINLTILIVISSMLFTGIENQTLLVEIQSACHHNRPSTCLDQFFADQNKQICE